MPTRDEVIANLKGQLDSLNAKMDELEARASQASGEAKADLEKRMQHLREMGQPAKDKLAELRASGEGQWEKLTGEAEKYSKALKHSFNYFKSQIK